MPDVRCTTAGAWTTRILDHGIDTGHANIAWDDTIGTEFGLRCLDCDTRFVIKSYELRTEYFATSGTHPARLLYEGLRTQKGRAALMSAILKNVTMARAHQPKTAWDHVLKDDD